MYLTGVSVVACLYFLFRSSRFDDRRNFSVLSCLRQLLNNFGNLIEDLLPAL